MALIDDILNRKKSSFYPVSEEELHEEATKTPSIPETTASDQNNKQPSEMVQPQQNAAAATPGNKWGYSQSEMDALAKVGYTPERLEYFMSDFDPSKGENILQRIYESSVPRPSEPDEKKIRNAKLVGTIADSLGLLSQMWSYGKGAHVRDRDNKKSASSQIAEQERNLRNIYLQQQNKYNDGLYNARIQDLAKSLENYNNGRKGIQGALTAKQKMDEAAAKIQFGYDKLAQDQVNKDRDYDLRKQNNESLDRHRKSLESQGWSRVTDSKNRTSAYVRKMSSSGSSGKNSSYQMIFQANPNDTDIQTDNFGNKVKVFEMTKGQIDQYAREALADKNFMDTHQDLILQRPDMRGSGAYKYKPNHDIAAAYLRELYEKKYAQTSVSASSTHQPYDWGQALPPVWNPGSTTHNTEEPVEEDRDVDEMFSIL